jgi:hypothetical protein
VVAGEDHAAVQRQQLGFATGLVDGVARFLQLAALHAVGGQDGDALAVQYRGRVRHNHWHSRCRGNQTCCGPTTDRP